MLLSLAWRNLWRQPRRTLLTLAAIAMAGAVAVFMMAFQFGTYTTMIDNTLALFDGHGQVQAPGYRDEPRMETVIADAGAVLAKVEAVDGVRAAAPRAMAFGVLAVDEDSFGSAIVGVDPVREPALSTIPGQVATGRFLEGPDSAEIVLGASLARNLGVTVGDRITLMGSDLHGSVAVDALEVVGLFESGDEGLDRQFAEVPLGRFRETFAMADAAHSVAFLVADPGRLEGVVEEIRGRVAVDALEVLDWDATNPGLRQAIRLDMTSSGLVYGTLVLVVAFTVLNTLLMSVLERTREFGMLLGLGIRPAFLGRVVWIETAMLAVLGLGLGTALGVGLAIYFNLHPITFGEAEGMLAQFGMDGGLRPRVDVFTILTGPLMLGLAVAVAGLIPAARIRRLIPIEAMRSA